MAVATKARKTKKPANVAPPIPKARKGLAINSEYEDRAKELVRYAIRDKKISIKELHQRLTDMGVEISAGGLANKISRGGFSAMFLLQCMDALDMHLETMSK